MDKELKQRITIVLETLIGDMIFKYQGYKSKTEKSSIKSFVSYNAAKEKVIEEMIEQLEEMK